MKQEEAEIKYTGLDNYQKPKAQYIAKIFGMNKEALKRETEHMIWLSAYASNNPRSDYHWMCDACYDACSNFEGLYEVAYKSVTKSLGY